MHHTSGTYQFKAHGGRIWAESAGHGKGSRFHGSVPYAGRAADAASAALPDDAGETAAGLAGS
jgi:hypothetical protein